MAEPNENPIEEEVVETPEVPETPEEPAEEPVEEPVEEPAEEPTEETPEEPAEEPEKPVDPKDYEVETRGASEDPKVEYGEEIDPEDIKTIGAIVEKQTAGVKQQLQDTRDNLEVDAFIKENPDFTKYKPVILKHMKHEAYSKIPVKNIAAMVASGDLLKLGAKKEREAQIKADSTKTKGTPARKPVGKGTNWQKASKESFEAQKNKVMGREI